MGHGNIELGQGNKIHPKDVHIIFIVFYRDLITNIPAIMGKILVKSCLLIQQSTFGNDACEMVNILPCFQYVNTSGHAMRDW